MPIFRKTAEQIEDERIRGLFDAARGNRQKKRYKPKFVKRTGPAVPPVTIFINRVCPPGYLPAVDWARKNGLSPRNILKRIVRNNIPHIVIGRCWHFVREDIKWEGCR